jgi:hypothetical protein
MDMIKFCGAGIRPPAATPAATRSRHADRTTHPL